MRTSIQRENGSVADQLEFQSSVTGTDRTSGPLTLVDESSSARILVKGSDSGLDVRFGTSAASPSGGLVCGTRPDEWMLLGSLDEADAIMASVNAEGFVAVLDQTHSRAMFRFGGADVVEAMEKVCSIDLSDDMTPDGAVFSASVAKVTCDVVRNDVAGTTSYLIMCDRSFGDYLFEALADCGEEFGLS